MQQRIELHTAFFWDCLACGKENFVRAVAIEMSQQERESLWRRLHDLEPWQPLPERLHSDFVVAPAAVQCGHCFEQFEIDESTAADDSEDPLLP